MIQQLGNRIEVGGSMTLADASTLLARGESALAAVTAAAADQAEAVFDLAAIKSVDSSSIAVIFAWLRQAQAQGKTLRIVHPPQDLLSLAALYGVTELLPLCSDA